MTTSSFAGSAFCFFSSAAFFLAAAKAASLEGGLDEPPSSPPGGKIGWMVMLPRRECGTLSHGVSAKKEVVDRWARFVDACLYRRRRLAVVLDRILDVGC